MVKRNDQKLRNVLLAAPEKAIGLLHHHYFKPLVQRSFFRTRNQQAAEDIVNTALAEIYLRSDYVATQPKSIFAYLLGIIRNKSIDYYHKSVKPKNTLVYYTDVFPEFSDHTTIETEITSREEKQTIWDILSTFPQRQRQIIIMKYYLNRSVNEMAFHLHISVKTVEAHITAINKKLPSFRSRLR